MPLSKKESISLCIEVILQYSIYSKTCIGALSLLAAVSVLSWKSVGMASFGGVNAVMGVSR